MDNEKPIDAFVRRLRGPIIAVAAVSVPISTLSYGWMVVDFVAKQEWWLSLIVVTAHFFGILGISCLFDNRQEQLRRQGRDR